MNIVLILCGSPPEKMHMNHMLEFYLDVTTNFPNAWATNDHEISDPIFGHFQPQQCRQSGSNREFSQL